MIKIKNIFNLLAKYGWPTTLAVLAIFAFGFTWSSSDALYSNIRLFDRIVLMIDQNYVENIDQEKMIGAGIDGMLSKLDNYTKFLRDGDFIRLKQETDGQLNGIGVTMEFHRDTLTIVSVLEDTPGRLSGLKPGDQVWEIDSVSTFDKKIKQIRSLMWGPFGSKLSLLINRPGDSTREIILKRDNVKINSIPYYSMINGETGYIRLAHFSENCGNEMKSAIRDLGKRGMQSLILDLRGNPGGLLIEAVDVAGIFLPEDSRIVETRGKSSTSVSEFLSYGKPIFPDGSLAVIVDEETASAAEIVAGAIQDHDRGVVIGTETYGKGLVQQVMQFSDDSALKITTSKYYLPSGRCLQKPDWSTFELITDKKARPTDSLYFTNSGRPVFGGGGIVPDIYVERFDDSEFIEALREQSCFFDFTLKLLRDNEYNTSLKVDNEVMQKFKSFLNDRDFEFVEDDRMAYNRLKNELTVFDDETAAAMEALDNKLQAKETWFFDSHYNEIQQILSAEIVFLSGGEQALYKEIWIGTHPEIIRAREILADSNEYLSILALR